MSTILSIRNLTKVYADGLEALREVNLDIDRGEIFALLGPNGAGKTTLINAVCGIINFTRGEIRLDGYDVVKDYRRTRAMIGLVPQELSTDAFESVWATVNFSRRLFGKPRNDAFIEQTLRQLSLWDKKDSRIMTLSGGMKRRVMIAKALSHEPRVLFLDEPTAGVDVNLRKDMWRQVRELRDAGVTIILTTHYIVEAEEMADRIGVINGGRIIVTQDKRELMKKLGRKQLIVELAAPLHELPARLSRWDLRLEGQGQRIVYHYASSNGESGIAPLLAELSAAGLAYRDIQTKQESLEEIFIQLVKPS